MAKPPQEFGPTPEGWGPLNANQPPDPESLPPGWNPPGTPGSGTPKRNWLVRHKVVTAVLSVLLLLVVISVANGGSRSATSASPSTSMAAPQTTTQAAAPPVTTTVAPTTTTAPPTTTTVAPTTTNVAAAPAYPPQDRAGLVAFAATGDAGAIHPYQADSVGAVGICPQPRIQATADSTIPPRQLLADEAAFALERGLLDNKCGGVVFVWNNRMESHDGGYTVGRVLLDAFSDGLRVEINTSSIGPDGQLRLTI